MSRFPGAKEALALSRRGFLIGAAGAGFTLAFFRHGLVFGDPAQAVARRLFEPTIWFDIDPEGRVTVNITKAEMGQHIGTALARIVADELDADWNLVSLRYVDSNPKWGPMVTGGSWSVWQSFDTLAQAGAAGRMTLLEEGAKLLGVSSNACQAGGGRISSGGKSLSYAEIVRRGDLNRTFSADQLKRIPLKQPAQRQLIGKPVQALDIPDKTDGRARYGIDAELEGMVYARPLIPPTRLGSKVSSLNEEAAKSVPGYLKTLILTDPSGTVEGWAMVFATSYFAALRASEKIRITWALGAAATVSEKDILDHAAVLIANPDNGVRVVDDEGVDQAFAGARRTLEQTYSTATVLHFQMEPLNALVRQHNGVWEIHTGNQWQSLIVPVLAKALQVSEDKVVMKPYLLGGGFGRRLNGDYAVPAALAAKAFGKPVKMVCTRADDVRFDSPRSASLQRVRMAFDADNNVIAMQQDAAAGWPTQVMMPSALSKTPSGQAYDSFAISGADHWYTVGAQRVRAIANDLANNSFRPGWLRSVGPGWTNWALESFMDEAALFAGVDPLEFRLSLLTATGKNAGDPKNSAGGAKRQANVLKRVAAKAGWGAKMPRDCGLGIASTFGQERDMPTWTACVAQVHVDRRSGVVSVRKLTIVTDAGTIVDPDGALAQVQGAALWGLSMALHEGTQFENGQVKDRNLDTYTPLRMIDIPEMDIEFVPSTETAVGLGEPATTVVGPAIGNAIHAAVGIRLRHLPMRPTMVLRALEELEKKS